MKSPCKKDNDIPEKLPGFDGIIFKPFALVGATALALRIRLRSFIDFVHFPHQLIKAIDNID